MIKPISLNHLNLWPLNDGYLEVNQRYILREFVGDLTLQMQVNGFLIKTEELLILVDTGAGIQNGPTTGHLVENLLHTGYTPNDITHILITHLHWDHIGGLLNKEGQIAFPSALLCVPKIEATYWRDPQEEALASKANLRHFATARSLLAPYEAAGHLRLIASQGTILPGVTAVPSFGHSPGHTAFLFYDELLLWGDIVHTAALQFSHPEWTVLFDIDEKTAAINRKALFERALKEHYLVGGGHLPGSGLGHISLINHTFTWEPLF